MTILQFLLSAVQIGAIYALVALGYSMVYGVAKLINFAHGEVIMVGAYCSWYICSNHKVGTIPMIFITILFCSLLGVCIERIAYRPLRKAEKFSLIITAIGVSLLLQNIVQLLFTATPRMYISIIDGGIDIGGSNLKYITIVTIISSTVLVTLLNIFVNKTKLGKALRAVSEDSFTAKLVGINVDWIISLTFAIGSALAGIAAIFYCSSYPQINPTMGYLLGLKAFVAAVLGGIGSIRGAVLGGFLIGIVEIFIKAYISSSFADAIVFGILIIILLVKPTGILGMKTNEKV